MTKIFLVLSACLLVACGGNRTNSEYEEHEHEHEHENEGSSGNELAVVDFDQDKAIAVGLKTQVVEPGTFTQAIKTSGRILAAQGDEQTLVATLPGVVNFRKTAFTEGTPVRKGQAVLSLVTGHLADGDVAVRTRAVYEKAKREYERATELIKDKIISEKDFNQAALDYQTAQTAFNAIGGAQSGNGIDICSPINGYLKNLRVKEGDYVETGSPLATVSQNNRLQLRVEIPEKYYSSLPLIHTAAFRTPYNDTFYPLADLNGRLLSYAKSMDANAFYIPVTFEFDNKGDILPGGYVEAFLFTSPIPNTFSIPLSSLIEEQGIYSVFIRKNENEYRKQAVTLGADNGSEVQILSGLKTGDEVVTEAAYHLKLASASNSLPEHHH
ncbi:MAG: efflux RND transporter periplasmic adaptor subunit [Tannerellaceae bacterium]|jgi:RND family efflux transporter MFP subunit|nr:efflux RND transporter periplasmic adaptor subunit [Tannerellaceae bacterium]